MEFKVPQSWGQNWKSGGENPQAQPIETDVYAIALQGETQENPGV